MSEMAIGSADALSLLRAHVESILAGSSVPSADRADIAEEMYGHLWLRWHEAVKAGNEESEAVEAAIRSFGGAGQLGRAMTGAYHSRLYATTIGVLLPAVAPSGRPVGVGRLRLLLATVVLLLLVVSPFVLVRLTPLRALVFAAGVGLQIWLGVLAYRAFGRAQRWALRYVQFTVVLVLVSGVAAIVGAPAGSLTIPLLPFLALYGLGRAIGPGIAQWVDASSRPISRKLGAVLIVAVVLGQTVPLVAPALPDPTQVSAADLDLSVSAVCTRDAAGLVTAMDVTAQYRWNRVDLFPYGLGGRPDLDYADGLALLARSGDGQRLDEYKGLWLEPSDSLVRQADWQGFIPNEWPEIARDGVSLGNDGALSPFATARMEPNPIPSAADFSNLLAAVELPATPRSGSSYVIHARYEWHSGSSVSPDSDPLVVVRYRHLDRFTVQALASCERSGPAVAMPSSAGS
jgi:hypothetical protein